MTSLGGERGGLSPPPSYPSRRSSFIRAPRSNLPRHQCLHYPRAIRLRPFCRPPVWSVSTQFEEPTHTARALRPLSHVSRRSRRGPSSGSCRREARRHNFGFAKVVRREAICAGQCPAERGQDGTCTVLPSPSSPRRPRQAGTLTHAFGETCEKSGRGIRTPDVQPGKQYVRRSKPFFSNDLRRALPALAPTLAPENEIDATDGLEALADDLTPNERKRLIDLITRARGRERRA